MGWQCCPVVGGERAAGKPPAAVDELLAGVLVEAVEARLDSRERLSELRSLGPSLNPLRADGVIVVEGGREAEEDAASRPGRLGGSGFVRGFPGFEAVDHLAASEGGRLPVEDAVDAEE